MTKYFTFEVFHYHHVLWRLNRSVLLVCECVINKLVLTSTIEGCRHDNMECACSVLHVSICSKLLSILHFGQSLFCALDKFNFTFWTNII